MNKFYQNAWHSLSLSIMQPEKLFATVFPAFLLNKSKEENAINR
jgi:hypothetical protein